MTNEERRIASTAYRVLSCQGEAQYRALDRLKVFVGEALAYELWLKTNPDPAFVEAIFTYRLQSSSPLRDIIKRPVSLKYPTTLTRMITR